MPLLACVQEPLVCIDLDIVSIRTSIHMYIHNIDVFDVLCADVMCALISCFMFIRGVRYCVFIKVTCYTRTDPSVTLDRKQRNP